MPYSWLLRAYTTTPDNYNLTYSLYRNNEVIASDLTTTTYSETINTTDKICYNVRAVYNDMVVATTNNVCLNDTDGVEDYHHKNINIYPNPANDKISIELAADYHTIEIYDSFGRMMMSQQVDETMSQQVVDVDISKYPSGLYLVVVKNDNSRYCSRIVKN